MAEGQFTFHDCDGKDNKKVDSSVCTPFATTAKHTRVTRLQENNASSENIFSESGVNSCAKENPQLWKFESVASSDKAFAAKSYHVDFIRRTRITEARIDLTGSIATDSNQDMHRFDAEEEFQGYTNQMEDYCCDSKLASRVANFAVSDQITQTSVNRGVRRDSTLLTARIPSWKVEAIPKVSFEKDVHDQKTGTSFLSEINNWNHSISQKQFKSSCDQFDLSWQHCSVLDGNVRIPTVTKSDTSQFTEQLTDAEKLITPLSSSFPLPPIASTPGIDDESCDLGNILPPPYSDRINASPTLPSQNTNPDNKYCTMKDYLKPSIWNTANASSEDSTNILDLAHSLASKIASHHIMLEAQDGFFATAILEYLVNSLNCFGDVARLRTEFSDQGLIFCTFYEIKTAIRAAKMWDNLGSMPSRMPPSKQPTSAIRDAFKKTKVHFSRPYEVIDERNSATVLVQLSNAKSLSHSLHEVGRVCSQFGEVTRIFSQPETTLCNSYIVEYNDARDVQNAVRNLNLSLHPTGSIVATRTASPLFDENKIIAFSAHFKKLRNSSSNCQDEVDTAPVPMKIVEILPTVADLQAPSAELLVTATQTNETTNCKGTTAPQTCPTNQASKSSPRRGDKLPAHEGEFEPAQRPQHTSIEAKSKICPFIESINQAQPTSACHGADYRRHENGYDLLSYPSHAAYSSMHSSLCHVDPRSVNKSTSAAYTNVQVLGNLQNRNASNGVNEFCLLIENVISGVDCRTTLMIRNIPNKYTQQMLLNEINRHHHGRYDFFYLPIDFKNKCNMGYAFLNFMEPSAIISFHQEFNQQKWSNFNSEKVCAISYARLQGKKAMIARFQNSSLLDKHESYRPLVFVSHGPNRGKPESFSTHIEQHGNLARHGQNAQIGLHMINHYQSQNAHYQRYYKDLTASSASCFCPYVALPQCQRESQNVLQKDAQDTFTFDYHSNQPYPYDAHHNFEHETHHPIQSSYELGYYQTQVSNELPTLLYPTQSSSFHNSEQSLSASRFALNNQNAQARIAYNGVIF